MNGYYQEDNCINHFIHFQQCPHLRVSVKAAAAGDFPLCRTRTPGKNGVELYKEFSLGTEMTACQAQL